MSDDDKRKPTFKPPREDKLEREVAGKNNIVLLDDVRASLREDRTIDITHPVLTVYGIQCWTEGTLIGTSLYSSQGKAMYCKQTLEKGESEQAQEAIRLGKKRPNSEFKMISYPVF